ncbi:ribosome silencing factor [Myxococcota bacterium]|nr:ribosome silencing factor [Myxococcota bacterium]MBU1429943.1 ribosome silencing factor [Myxococcota bacterium]MBU1899046.1 ribosome silencing factor [Myxococcota bacterium]
MEPKELALHIAQMLDDKQAEEIVLLEVEALVSYTSYFVIATGRSEMHVRALAQHLEREMKTMAGRPLSLEGVQSGRWALIDYGDAVIHIFHKDERYIYDLEGLWREAPALEFEGA